MAKQRRKQRRPALLAYRQGDYVSLHIHLPVKWIVAIILPILIKLIPEWWSFLQDILPTLLK
jgi:hypothetical protein